MAEALFLVSTRVVDLVNFRLDSLYFEFKWGQNVYLWDCGLRARLRIALLPASISAVKSSASIFTIGLPAHHQPW